MTLACAARVEGRGYPNECCAAQAPPPQACARAGRGRRDSGPCRQCAQGARPCQRLQVFFGDRFGFKVQLAQQRDCRHGVSDRQVLSRPGVKLEVAERVKFAKDSKCVAFCLDVSET